MTKFLDEKLKELIEARKNKIYDSCTVFLPEEVGARTTTCYVVLFDGSVYCFAGSLEKAEWFIEKKTNPSLGKWSVKRLVLSLEDV